MLVLVRIRVPRVGTGVTWSVGTEKVMTGAELARDIVGQSILSRACSCKSDFVNPVCLI